MDKVCQAKQGIIHRTGQYLKSLKHQLLKNIGTIMGIKKADMINGLYSIASISLCPILIYVLFKRADLLAVSMFGALFTSRTDPGGIYPVRLRTMLLGACLLIVSYLLSALIGGGTALTVCLIFVWSFGLRMLNVFGSRGIRLGSIAVFSLIVFLSMPSEVSQIAIRCYMIMISALCAIVIKLWAWPTKPYQPVRDAVAGYYRVLRILLASNNDEDMRKKALVMRRPRNIAYLTIRDLKGKYNQTTWKMYLLLKKADSLHTVYIALSECTKTAMFQTYRSSVQKAVDMTMEAADQMLVCVAASIQRGKPIGGNIKLEPVLKELSGSPALKGESSETEDYNIVYLFGLLEQYIKIIQSMVEIIDNPELKLPVKTGKSTGRHSAFKDKWHLIAENMTLQSKTFRHSLRLSITLAVAASVYIIFNIPHGYWITLAAAIILKDDFQATWQRALQRVGGTITGSIIAFVIAAFIHNVMILFLFIIVFLFLASANYSRDYGIYVFFWTPVVVSLIDLNNIGNWIVAMQRIGNTFAGGILALIAIYLLFPQWEKKNLPNQIAKALSSNRSFMQTVLGTYCGKAVTLFDIEQLRQQTNRECVNATAALQCLSAEPESTRDSFEKFHNFIVYNQQLCDVLTTLSLNCPKLNECDALLEVWPLIQQVDETLQEIEVALRSGQGPEVASESGCNLIPVGQEMSSLITAKIYKSTDDPIDSPNQAVIIAYTPLITYLQRLMQSIDGLYRTAFADSMNNN
jgi:Predicted membrane protein